MAQTWLLLFAVAFGFAATAQQCGLETTCSACTSTPSGQCGWAADQNSCLVGTASGPSGTSSTDWMWDLQDCNCLNYTYCNECLSHPGCGWINGNTCGTVAAPGAVMSCPCDFTSCAACTGNEYYSCGWAADKNACLGGTALGPLGTTSSNWLFGISSCLCLGIPTCAACNLLPSCQWIYGTTCGSNTGPNSVPSCNGWPDTTVTVNTGLGTGIVLVIVFVAVLFTAAVSTTGCIIWNRRRAVVVAPTVGYNTIGAAQSIVNSGEVGGVVA